MKANTASRSQQHPGSIFTLAAIFSFIFTGLIAPASRSRVQIQIKKKEFNELCRRLGEAARYPIEFERDEKG